MAEAMVDMGSKSQAIAKREGKYLTFSLAGEEYGLGILKVKEIIGLMPITLVPRTPDYVKGVINLRGKVIPIVELRKKFGMDAVDYTERTCIVVMEIANPGGPILMGIIVDSVSEVLNIKNAEIEDPPEIGSNLDTDYILGMAKINGGVKILLDIDRVMQDNELNLPSA